MWLSSQLVGMFQISKEAVEALREDLAQVRAERDTFKSQLATAQANFDWLKVRVNSLEIERAQLIKKAYNIDTAVPEIVRTSANTTDLNPDLFNDMGEDFAKRMGLPVYGN